MVTYRKWLRRLIWHQHPWAFYILPACAYAYRMFVKKNECQRLSHACAGILKGQTQRGVGRLIDLLAITGLLAGTATTFSLATPLLAAAVGEILGIETGRAASIFLLAVIGLVFIAAVMKGMRAISYLASACVAVFVCLLAVFLIFGPKIYILETGITAMGTVVNDFFRMATWMDPLRLSGKGGNGFPQDWTIFYWAYWISWF